MIRLFAIARNAFVEAIRQPIYGVLILVAFGVLVLDLPLSGWTMGKGAAEYYETDQQMMISLGLSTLLVSGLFIAAFSASGVLSREIEDKTILTVISKPVVRPVVVLGKFAGVAAALVVAYYLCSLVFLMTVRHKVMPRASDPYDFPVIVLGCAALAGTIGAALFCNYFFGWHFGSSAVGFGVVLLTVAMGAIVFVGKGWTAVPPGYDVPPKTKPGIVRVELKDGYSREAFLERIAGGPFKVEKAEWDRSAATIRFPRRMTPEAAIRDLEALDEVGKAGPVTDPPPVITARLLIAIVLLFMCVLVFVAVAVAASTRLGQVTTLLVCFGFFLVGSISQYLFGRYADVSSPARVAYLIWTNLPFFYALDALAAGRTISLGYVGLTAVYAGCHVAAILAVGMALFQKRELTAQVGSGAVAAPPLVSLLAWSGRAAALAAGVVAVALPADVAGLGMAKTIALRVGLAGSAVFGWLLWGWFGRGRKWTYFFTFAGAALGLAAGGAVLLWGQPLRSAMTLRFIIRLAAPAAVVLILLLPRTRHHFGLLRQSGSQ